MTVSSFIPYDKFVIETKYNSFEIQGIITANVEPRRWFRNPLEPYAFFEGQIKGERFKMRRVLINYRTSFIPVIEGRIRDGSVKVVMRLYCFVAFFSAVWLVFTAGMAITALRSDSKSMTMFFVFLGMFLFYYSLGILLFKFEAKKAKLFLYDLLV